MNNERLKSNLMQRFHFLFFLYQLILLSPALHPPLTIPPHPLLVVAVAFRVRGGG
jgi:hypothetical protein